LSTPAERRQRILAASERLHASRLGLHQSPPEPPGPSDSGSNGSPWRGLLAQALGPFADAFTTALGANAELSFEAACELALALANQRLVPAIKRHPWLSLTSSLLAGAWLARQLLRGGKGSFAWRTLEPWCSDALARAASQALAEGLAALLADRPADPAEATNTSTPTPAEEPPTAM